MSETRNKTLMLQDTIYQLYVIEGKSLNSISKLLFLNRKEMTEIIKNEFEFERGNVKQATPRIQKLLNQHKQTLLDYMGNTDSRYLVTCFSQIGITENLFRTLCRNDKELDEARNLFNSRESKRQELKKKRELREESWNQDINSIPNEVWLDILGYEGRYQISNFARIKSTTGAPRIMMPDFNEKIGRYQVVLYDINGKPKSHKRYRLVAHAFVHNSDPSINNTVNHIDGDSTNDLPNNLEWCSQKYQNWHKNKVLGREIAEPYKRNGRFTSVVIDDKYTFKTLAAAARFLEVSETQIQRYIRLETKTDRKIELIY